MQRASSTLSPCSDDMYLPTYGNSQESEMDDRLREFLGVFCPDQVNASPVPRDDASLDDVIADSLV